MLILAGVYKQQHIYDLPSLGKAFTVVLPSDVFKRIHHHYNGQTNIIHTIPIPLPSSTIIHMVCLGEQTPFKTQFESKSDRAQQDSISQRQHSTSSQASKLSMHSLDQNYNFYFDHGGIHGSAGGGRQGHGRGAVSLSGMPMPMMEMVTVTVTEMVMELQVVVVRGMEERFHFLGCQCQARQIHIRMHPVVTN